MNPARIFRGWTLLGIGALAWATGCAVNPASGQREFVLMSESQEIALGRSANPRVLIQYGRYDDVALQRYVQTVGEKLAAHSDRPGLVYRFTVVDSPEVNAFALPGGYIYITRGLLAYLENEAQLAAVLGHEIGHVTARHAVRQYTAATVTGLVTGVASTALGAQGAQDLFGALGAALVRGYGRDMELQADHLGARYLARAGYDPRAMIEVLALLENQERFDAQLAKAEGRAPRSYHGVFATHPSNDTRLQRAVAEIGPAPGTRVDRPAGEGAFLAHLDGLVYGDGARQGIRRANRFYHPVLGFAIVFPPGWILENGSRRLVAHAPGGAAVMELAAQDLNRRIPPRQFVAQRMKVPLRDGAPLRAGGHEGYTGIATAHVQAGVRQVRLTVVYFHDRAYLLAGLAGRDRDFPLYDGAFLDTARSFHELSGAEQALARPLKLRIIRARAGSRMADLAADSPLSRSAVQLLRLLNGLYPDGEPRPGQPIKVVE